MGVSALDSSMNPPVAPHGISSGSMSNKTVPVGNQEEILAPTSPTTEDDGLG
jgi:hypothetical protein